MTQDLFFGTIGALIIQEVTMSPSGEFPWEYPDMHSFVSALQVGDTIEFLHRGDEVHSFQQGWYASIWRDGVQATEPFRIPTHVITDSHRVLAVRIFLQSITPILQVYGGFLLRLHHAYTDSLGDEDFDSRAERYVRGELTRHDDLGIRRMTFRVVTG